MRCRSLARKMVPHLVVSEEMRPLEALLRDVLVRFLTIDNLAKSATPSLAAIRQESAAGQAGPASLQVIMLRMEGVGDLVAWDRTRPHARTLIDPDVRGWAKGFEKEKKVVRDDTSSTPRRDSVFNRMTRAAPRMLQPLTPPGKVCYNCCEQGHIAKECKAPRVAGVGRK